VESLSKGGDKKMKESQNEIRLEVEVLEERIAPSATGSLGYEGQPGNQGNGQLGYEGQPGNQGGAVHNP
jgi:hypothetical protein